MIRIEGGSKPVRGPKDDEEKDDKDYTGGHTNGSASW